MIKKHKIFLFLILPVVLICVFYWIYMGYFTLAKGYHSVNEFYFPMGNDVYKELVSSENGLKVDSIFEIDSFLYKKENYEDAVKMLKTQKYDYTIIRNKSNGINKASCEYNVLLVKTYDGSCYIAISDMCNKFRHKLNFLLKLDNSFQFVKVGYKKNLIYPLNDY